MRTTYITEITELPNYCNCKQKLTVSKNLIGFRNSFLESYTVSRKVSMSFAERD